VGATWGNSFAKARSGQAEGGAVCAGPSGVNGTSFPESADSPYSSSCRLPGTTLDARPVSFRESGTVLELPPFFAGPRQPRPLVLRAAPGVFVRQGADRCSPHRPPRRPAQPAARECNRPPAGLRVQRRWQVRCNRRLWIGAFCRLSVCLWHLRGRWLRSGRHVGPAYAAVLIVSAQRGAALTTQLRHHSPPAATGETDMHRHAGSPTPVRH
jgi:hypothetical protein